MLSFQCPPIPVRGTSHENEVLNSHDMLAIFTSVAFQQQNERLNEERRKRQEQIRDEYRQKLKDNIHNAEQAYGIMCQYTQKYLGTYLNHPFTENDILTLPIDYADKFKKDIISYSNAMSIIHERPPMITERVDEHILNCAQIITTSQECRPIGKSTEPVPIQSPASLEWS
jgi:malate synthase